MDERNDRISRRGLLAAGVAVGILPGRAFAQALNEGTLPPKSPAGIATTAVSNRLRATGMPSLRDNPVAYVEYCRSMGAGGVQHAISTDLVAVRKRLDDLGMYYEGEMRMPARRDADLGEFEASVRNSAALGATVARAVCRPPAGTSGRRYEGFTSFADFKAWQAEADAIVLRCLPIAAKYKVKIGLENHKDRTADELAGFLRQTSHEYLGCLIDPGNNMSFMERPADTIKTLAPFVVATSLKDMGVALYDEGFLMAEVPFGAGMSDQKALFAAMRKANPKLHPTTELITRNPLKVPVLTPAYLASFAPGHGARVKPWMAMIGEKASKLTSVDGMTPAQVVALEDANNRQVFAWASANLV
jgi:sugar phosphate isomerase/epimerase